MKRFRWLLTGVTLLALSFVANPGSAAAATSPANGGPAISLGSHVTSARVNPNPTPSAPASSPRPTRTTPARHAPSRALPHGPTRGHRSASRLSRTSHGKGHGPAAALAVSDSQFDADNAAQTQIAWLRAPRSTTPAMPETRGPPRASPTTNSRPHSSPSHLPTGSPLLGRAPSNQPSNRRSPHPSIPPVVSDAKEFPEAAIAFAIPFVFVSLMPHRATPDRNPHARRHEGPAPWPSWPSGGSTP